MNARAIFPAFVTAMFCFSCLRAADFGVTAANFLKLGAGARNLGMAETGATESSGADAVYWNPSGMAFVEGTDLQSSYMNTSNNAHFSHLAFTKAVPAGVLGAAAAIFFSPELDGRDELDQPSGNFTFYNWAFTAAYAKKWSDNIAVGFSVKMIRESIGDKTGDGAAFDIGAGYRAEDKWIQGHKIQVSGSLQNLGPDMGPGRSSPLPTIVRAGISDTFMGKKWISAVDAAAPLREDFELRLGNEWKLYPAFSLRTGYRFLHSNRKSADWYNFFSGGFGFYFSQSASQRYNLDYAFTPFAGAGLEHRISFGVNFP